MRLSSSSTYSVGATQFERFGIWGSVCDAPFARFWRKSKPGTNFPKPKFWFSLMVRPLAVACAQLTASTGPAAVFRRRSMLVHRGGGRCAGGRLGGHGQLQV